MRRERFVREYALADYDVEVLTASPRLAEYYESVARTSGDAKGAANWVMGEVMAAVNASDGDITRFRVRPADLAQLIKMVRDGKLSGTAAKSVFKTMVQTGDRAEQVAEREGLLQVGDDSALAGWIDEVLAENPDEARRFAAGEKKLQGVLVGLVMRKSKGRADPKRVNQLLATRAGG